MSIKENKTSFIIVRVTRLEKEYLVKMAKKSKAKFSDFIRTYLGLE